MPSRRKLDRAKIHASLQEKNPDDPRPWFLVGRLLPPEWCEVRLAWRDGNLALGAWSGTTWTHYYQSTHGQPAPGGPVGWKPLLFGAAGNPRGQRLPDPHVYGLEIIP